MSVDKRERNSKKVQRHLKMVVRRLSRQERKNCSQKKYTGVAGTTNLPLSVPCGEGQSERDNYQSWALIPWRALERTQKAWKKARVEKKQKKRKTRTRTKKTKRKRKKDRHTYICTNTDLYIQIYINIHTHEKKDRGRERERDRETERESWSNVVDPQLADRTSKGGFWPF